MSEEEAYKIFSEMTPDVVDYVFCLTKAYTEKDKEIERLNNIIKRFEEYLNKVIETSTEQERITCSFVLQYLQELKGSDKE